jgi:quercetin dioxygenase-like cupin family protein
LSIDEEDAMPMHAITVPRAEARRTETPNAVMTTFASPSLGGARGLSLWQVEMRAGREGPAHAFDSEQVWMVAAGEISVRLGDETVALAQGDTIVLPARVVRRISAVSDARMIVCGHGDAVTSVPGEDAPRGTPPWIS